MLLFFLTCREAKIHDALLFFDECEAIFEDREKHGSNHVNMLLTEVEKHEGIIIMATNRFVICPCQACGLTQKLLSGLLNNHAALLCELDQLC